MRIGQKFELIPSAGPAPPLRDPRTHGTYLTRRRSDVAMAFAPSWGIQFVVNKALNSLPDLGNVVEHQNMIGVLQRDKFAARYFLCQQRGPVNRDQAVAFAVNDEAPLVDVVAPLVRVGGVNLA